MSAKQVEKNGDPEEVETKFNFEIGERVTALWLENTWFPATITRQMPQGGVYEIAFDDGVKMLKKEEEISKLSDTEETSW